ATSVSLNSNPKLTYALDRQIGGSQLLTYTNGTDNFFTYLLAPSIVEETDRVARHYIFVIDTSGSMRGEPLEQAKTAFSTMIEDLSENDLFNVISFNSLAYPLWDEPRFATSSVILSAQNWVNDLTSGGLTNFYDACSTGLDNFYAGETVKVLLVLSDGRPTTGDVTSSSQLLPVITELNLLNVSISTIAFGPGADLSLMANLASDNNGYYTYIEPNEDATSKLIEFYKTMATPLASSYSIQVVGAIEITSLYPLSRSPFFNGSEFVLTGRYLDALTIQTTINYAAGPETYINTAGLPSSSNSHVELIWAQNRLNYLLRLVEITGSSDYSQELTSIALCYGLIIKGYTAIILVVEDPDAETDETNEPPEPEDPYTDDPTNDPYTDPNTDPTDHPYATADIDDVPTADEAATLTIAPLIFGAALLVFMKRRKMKKVVG
ncbi:MAG: vWA domain-containing protein, partial [Candidatus Kariarchaeaceae archaeon]